MTARMLIALAPLLLALALPQAALAQGAGDEQYQDPFGEEQGQPEPTATATPAPSQPAPAPTAAPSQAQPAPPSATPEPVPAAATGPQLPRTGADAGLLALAGGLLLAAGLALRRADHQR